MSTEELLRDDARTAGIATLVELLDYRVERQGDDVVFRFVSGDGAEEGAFTYRALRARAQAIAAGLRAHADPGDRVVLLVPPGLDYVASFFACLYAGTVAVPAYPPNPRRADPRVHRIIADSRARVALVHSSLEARRRRYDGSTWAICGAMRPHSPARSRRAPISRCSSTRRVRRESRAA